MPQLMVSSTDILNARILIVDDKETNVRLLEGMLRVAGYVSVESTTDPNQVCPLYRLNRYSLILLDLQMPGMDGFAVMDGLRQIEGEGYLPVLVITAQPAHKLHALAAGAKDFVSKPFDMAELQARVHNILEVRLLHLELKETVRELEASREVIRLQTLAEKKQREWELGLARETQESLLPRFLPEFENFDIHAFSSPTRYVGGDFYDFLQLNSGELAGVLADVSGKGLPAALLSSMLLGALSMELRSGTTPCEVAARINQLLCEKSLPFQFVTLFLFSLTPNGAGQFISAGHNPAYLYRADSGEIESLVSCDHFVGMFEFATFESKTFHLQKGDILVVYSDGLTDAENRSAAVFGKERLLTLIREKAPQGSHALEQHLLDATSEFNEGVVQSDDITFVIVQKR
jgi:serine phosphatase RsbU (regulator of sigma subunit)